MVPSGAIVSSGILVVVIQEITPKTRIYKNKK
jgi:hypothetical protein